MADEGGGTKERTTDNRSDLLNYVRALRDRHKDDSSRSGMTVWAVVIGIIYVLWKLVPQFSELSNYPDYRWLLCRSFVYLHVAILSGYNFIQSGQGRLPKHQFDYRISSDITNVAPFIIYIVVATAFPLYAIYYGIDDLSFGSFSRVQLQIDKWVLIIDGAMGLGIFIFLLAQKIRSGHPFPFNLATEDKRLHHRLLNFSFQFVSFEMMIGNVAAGFLPLLAPSSGQSSLALLCGLNIS